MARKKIEYKAYNKMPKYISKKFPVLFDGMYFTVSETDYLFIAWIGDVPIGGIYGSIEGFKMVKGELRPEVFVNKFEIIEDERGKGYGTRMFEFLVKKYNPLLVNLYALDDDALRFWRKLGFRRESKNDTILIKKFK